MVQRHEILAWLGDDDGDLTAEQVDQLARTADDIAARYPDRDDEDERQAALIVAYQLLLGRDVVDELAGKLLRARQAEATALAGLKQAALQLVDPNAGDGDRGLSTLKGFARAAGLHHTAVRGWIGKR